jgi:nucleotide-binding universal stress UspA family protein
MAVLQGGKADRSCLVAAHAVARIFDGHVEALHVRADPRAFLDYAGDAMTGEGYAQLMDAVEKETADKAATARAAFDAWARETGVEILSEPAATAKVSAAWAEKTGAEDRVVGRDGRLRDVVVLLSSAGQQDVRGEQTIERAMFESGRPVLVVPRDKAVERFERIAIFWNGSKEAVRAVEAAMPLLRHARAVDVMWVDEDVERDAVQDGLAAYLAWHGVAAKTKRFAPDKRFIGEMLMDEAAKAEADLVVMGGYSHSRLREFILGGVTQHMLETATLPVLVAH